jgi:ubiquinol-cytochrome c reductase cytochrome b subunit
MGAKLLSWIDDRLPVRDALKSIMKEDIPGGASYFYAFGSALLFVFLIQVITGVWQLFYYVPTTDHAYTSLSYLRISVPYGWLIHGLHYWGAQAMIVLVGLHMIQVFIWGAYKHPRQLTWLLGVLLLLMTASLSFTGVLLPWDEVGYFASQVGTNITSTFPGIGNGLKHFLLGGDSIGQLTLTRFFVFHIAIIPAMMLLFVILHLVAFRQAGSAGPWKKSKHAFVGQFWPDQVYKDMIVSALLLLVLIALTVYVGAPFSGPADPLDNSYHPVPEWNFLFLFQALKAFKGAWEPLGTVALPVLLVLFMVSIPFIDRKDDRNPMKRPLVMSLFFIFTATILVLTISGKRSVPEVGQVSPSITKIPLSAASSAKIQEGHSLFLANNCAICHSINGVGGTIGPDLSHETAKGRTAQWIVSQIKNPKVNNPASVMPVNVSLTDSQITALSSYLLNVDQGSPVSAGTTKINPSKNPNQTSNSSEAGVNLQNQHPISGLASSYIGNPAHGEILYRQTCEGCHGPNGVGKVPNPGSDGGSVPGLNPISRKIYNLNSTAFIDQIDPIIQNGSVPAGLNPALKMPDFGKSNTLTQQQIAQIEAYILSINGVDRAQLENPGIKPERFMLFSLGLFVVASLILLFFRMLKSKVNS